MTIERHVSLGFWAALLLPVLAWSAEPSGPPVTVTLDSGRTTDGRFHLVGQDARQQLVVTGQFPDGSLRDLTRQAKFEHSPSGIVQIDQSGLVISLADGEAVIAASVPGAPAVSVRAVVAHFSQDAPVNFANQVVPIFTKFNCNSGGCHGKASGQNGFKLSLLGFEPTEDYEHLLKEGRGRRIFPAAPDKSLLLLKPSGDVPHGGGARIPRDSYAYRILQRWIRQGMPYGRVEDPQVTAIELVPAVRLMSRQGEQQLAVVARYSDGSTEDVTRQVQFESNNLEMAEVSPTGLVRTFDQTGDVAVMARYLGQVSVFRATVPMGIPVDGLPAPRNLVDELVFAKLRALGLPPSAACDDATFVRRTALDLAGRLPTPDETLRFVADADPAKREKWIEALLASGEHADFFAGKWNAVLRNKRQNESHARGTFAFHQWIREQLYHNTPYDQFVRQILAASGDVGSNPAVTWYREVRDVHEQVEDAAQLFLGLRIQCARCHHHPFEKWSQHDYYALAAFFSRVGRKAGEQPGEERVFHQRGAATATHPKTQQPVAPAGLGGPSLALAPDDDPRQALVDWMAAPDNPHFARALVNRYWKHFFGRGLVDPEDDMRLTNPACNPELLDALARQFVASGYDLRGLVRLICTSQVYQFSSEPNQHNAADKQNFSRYFPKRLPAEVLLDAIDHVTGTKTGFGGMPSPTRAVQLPDTTFGSYFLTVFGRPESSSACECERSGEASLAQSLHLLNSAEVQGKLSAGDGRAAQLAADQQLPPAEKVRRLYLLVYSREPLAEETAVALAHLEKRKDVKLALEDILWALINTKEFLFNH
jgi:hypothetical protein